MFLLLFLLFFTKPVLAVNDFSVQENISYLVDNSGQADVTHQINITNNFSQIYPQDYQLSIQGISLINLNASDNGGNILQSSNTLNEVTTIKLKFNQIKTGKGQITAFKLNYKIPNFAKNKGKTWEISLPQSVGDNSLQSQIQIQTPLEFGSLSFASIPVKFENLGGQNKISFNSNSKNKILIILGNYQLFNFTLNYQLNNPSPESTFSEIALIPDTYSQSVFYQSISPPPLSIRIDSDGNWLARYQLKPQENIDITAVGQVKTGIVSPQSTPDLNLYLKEQSFWPISDPQIQNISQNLSTPRSIYDYVVNTLNYDYDRINSATRLGAVQALAKPNNALCTEFTDLFITLARAKNIAAREIEGYAYSNNSKIKPTNLQSDILHAWPEYFDTNKNLWKAIDPTWAKTTNGIDYFNDLDLNHVTFVIHGLDSQLPQAPNAHLEFASEEIKSATSLPLLSLQSSRLTIQNNTPNSQKNLQLSIPSLKYSSVVISLPKLSFFSSLLPKYQKFTINLNDSNDLSSTQSIQNPSHFLNLGISIIASLIILSISGIIITSHHHEKNT